MLGSPIAHSLSPVLHRAAYAALGLAGWTYDAVECTESQLGDVLRRLEGSGLAGVSLTMPLKRAVLPMLARSERIVSDVGVANTVLFGGVDGDWWGANTDVAGLVAAIRSARCSRLDSAAVVGAGATAASAVAAMAELGLRSVTVYARNPSRAGDLLAAAARLAVTVDVRPWADAPAGLAVDLVVATTPAGVTDGLASQLPERLTGALVDVVYAPWPTQIAQAWSAAGGLVVGGLEMLVAQAGEQVRLMTGHEPPIAEMAAAGRAALAAR